eukprot:11172291-Lingulodinium_polyedra.AAC.1
MARARGAGQNQGPREPNCNVVIAMGSRWPRIGRGRFCGVRHGNPGRPPQAKGPCQTQNVHLADEG